VLHDRWRYSGGGSHPRQPAKAGQERPASSGSSSLLEAALQLHRMGERAWVCREATSNHNVPFLFAHPARWRNAGQCLSPSRQRQFAMHASV
jgi:hypothetical protein